MKGMVFCGIAQLVLSASVCAIVLFAIYRSVRILTYVLSQPEPVKNGRHLGILFVLTLWLMWSIVGLQVVNNYYILDHPITYTNCWYPTLRMVLLLAGMYWGIQWSVFAGDFRWLHKAELWLQRKYFTQNKST